MGFVFFVTLQQKQETADQVNVINGMKTGSKNLRSLLVRRCAATLAAVLFAAAPCVATEFVNAVRVIGGNIAEVYTQKMLLASQGWQLVDMDLNCNCNDGHDKIYLLYTTCSLGEAEEFVTDFYVRIKYSDTSAPETIVHDGRTYHLVPFSGGSAFTESRET